MQTIIVPTDFSATATNAAEYAVHFALQVKAKRILLYHAYELPVALDPMMPGIQITEVDDFRKAAEDRLYAFRSNFITKYSDTNLIFDVFLTFGSIIGGLASIEEKEPIELIIMGITGGNALEETFIGSNTISVTENIEAPVIIVPAKASFDQINHIMLACDFNDAEKYLPVKEIKSIQTHTNSRVHVFNIEGYKDEYDTKFPVNIMGESFAVHTVLQELNPEYHYSHEKNYVEAVNQFVDTHHINLIITVPKEHHFFARLFRESHTKKLAFHSKIPLMVAKKN
jgi:nucleotide-binding universal stress UspA family protein